MTAMPPDSDRNERDIFRDLERLAAEPGFAHAIAALCLRDNFALFDGTVQPDQIADLFSSDRLARAEISTLIGLLVKSEIDLSIPDLNELQRLCTRAQQLLAELHRAIARPLFESLVRSMEEGSTENPFTRGEFLREPMFYGPESAYSFQYQSLATKKFSADNEWLQSNKGFAIDDAAQVIGSIGTIQIQKIPATIESLRGADEGEWTLLPAFKVRSSEIAESTGFDRSTVENVLKAFSLDEGPHNESFCSISDFNLANAAPLIRVGEQEFLLFQHYSLLEAMYESPFFWMANDPDYESRAAGNRGTFTERFVADRLRLVFGTRRVHENVNLTRAKSVTFGEVDVLALFGNRAVVVQAKSKRLTIESRKGNDRQIKADFKKAVLDACEQGRKCAEAMLDRGTRASDGDSRPVSIPQDLKEIYVMSIVADHYPSLAFQARQIVDSDRSTQVMPPLVLDVFALDAITEMLRSPLGFLSYINRRVAYRDKVMANSELAILSYHLRKNLWIDPDFDVFQLEDNICADLDAAMLVRRQDLPGRSTPDGILTRFRDTTVGRIIESIEQADNPVAIDIGFMLLTLDEQTVFDLSDAIDATAERTRSDGRHHNVTLGFGSQSSGITVFSSNEPDHVERDRLRDYCAARKYRERASTWFGLSINPRTCELRFGLSCDYPWERSEEMDRRLANMRDGISPAEFNRRPRARTKKVGRNSPCPCGSGKKFKRSCIGR